MQISTGQDTSKIQISGDIPEIIPSAGRGRRYKILSCFVILLLTCSLFIAGTYSFLALDGAQTASKLVDNVKNYYGITTTIVPTKEPERQYNDRTLSYFSSDELAKLGILALPENYQIQDEYKGIKFVRSPKQSFGQDQLGLLKMFIDRLPAKLLNPGPTAIVTYKAGEIKQGTNFNTSTAAFASGTYIFFNDNSFKPEQPLADDSVDAAFNTFTHEMAHVAQFNSVSDKLSSLMIETSYQTGLSWIDLIVISDITEGFASVTGWEKSNDGSEIIYKLSNPDSEKTTSYGKTKIYEDMAETIAGSVSANFYEFSDGRQTWALNYLNTTKEAISKNKFPTSATLNSVTATALQYDTSKENVYKQNYRYFDKQTFVNETVNSEETEINFLQTELKNRGWSGEFVRSADKNNVIRYKGDFIGIDRDMYIEVISYDNAKGYIVKPRGTIVVVLSGYLKNME